MNGNGFSARSRMLVRSKRAGAGMAVALLGLLGACSEASVAEEPEPATVTEVSEGLAKITLTERAAERLGIETVPVEAAAEGLALPYGALMYHYDGSTWTYVEVEPLSYQRESVQVQSIEDGRAVLSGGPAAGTPVVNVGAAELYGIEFGIGK